ncbi:arginine--tRNA ligase [Candidatus Woesearchaeota archaeon]|nr:arginine--tRNA ligase [Candidatus Woesearchaeota archaeon]
MNDYRKAIAGLVARESGIPAETAEGMIAVPPDKELGDFSFPCFALSKEMKKNPAEIASGLQQRIKPSGIVEKIVANGPYLNFFLNKAMLAEAVISEISASKEKYGSLNLKNRKALIEHTSINPNASPHVGRARNAIIGDSLSRILRFHGYRTEVHYFVNDIGKQIAMLVFGCGSKRLEFKDLLDEYVKINAELEKNPELEKKVFELLKKLEDGDKQVIARFRRVVELCIIGQAKLFEELGIRYDFFDYESKYLWDKKTEDVLRQLQGTGRVFVDADGRNVLNLEGFGLAMEIPVFVLTRADKTSLYGLRDLAYNLDKISRAKDRNIVVLGEDHKLYFRQIESTLSLMGLKAPEAVHYSFILLASGKMSTRSGNLVLLEEFMQQALEKAVRELASRGKSMKNSRPLAKAIGYGALKYHIIKVSPEKNVVFDWEQALSFDGESAPYIQYAHARICSILKKASLPKSKKTNFSLLGAKEETGLASALANFPEIAERACSQLRPHLIANYAYLLADSFNRFYHACPVLSEEKELMNARLQLILCVKYVLEICLSLLGIESPESM